MFNDFGTSFFFFAVIGQALEAVRGFECKLLIWLLIWRDAINDDDANELVFVQRESPDGL